MEAEPDIAAARVAAFVRQLVHDLRNILNSLDLETGLLQELAPKEEAQASAERVHQQVRILNDRLRSISAFFYDGVPTAMPIAARELLVIWREQQATLPDALDVQWTDELGDEKVSVDVEMMVAVFRELLANAAAFSQGGRVAITARRDGQAVILTLAEPKSEALDPSGWGRPFSTLRQGHYGLGLWAARRLSRASGANFEQRYDPRGRQLITQLSLPVQ